MTVRTSSTCMPKESAMLQVEMVERRLSCRRCPLAQLPWRNKPPPPSPPLPKLEGSEEKGSRRRRYEGRKPEYDLAQYLGEKIESNF